MAINLAIYQQLLTIKEDLPTLYYYNWQMKSHERILELHSLLSKLLDSLCFELTVNKNDENCLSLLEYIHSISRMLQWRRKGDISQ